MPTIVSFKNLSKTLRDSIIQNTNNELSVVAINRKQEQQEPLKSNILNNPIYIYSATDGIQYDFITGYGNIQGGFTGPNSIEFYINVLNAIDNMILLDFIRDNQPSTTTSVVDYSVTKTNDISLDMALVYYSIKYPNDTVVNTEKLNKIKNELNTNFLV
jgi:hypothetical protein